MEKTHLYWIPEDGQGFYDMGHYPEISETAEEAALEELLDACGGTEQDDEEIYAGRFVWDTSDDCRECHPDLPSLEEQREIEKQARCFYERLLAKTQEECYREYVARWSTRRGCVK